MAEAYTYSSSAGAMSLVGSVAGDTTSITIDDVSGLPASTPFKLVIDPGLSTEEIVKVDVVAGTTLTVVRGWDGTSGQAHANLASVRHMVTAEDLRLSRQHEDSSSDVHGVAGAVVGSNDAQSLTNKDLTDATNTFPTSLARKTALDAETAARTAHEAATSAHGTTSDLVGVDDVQTLTGKTISGATNTIVNVDQSSVLGLETRLGQDESDILNRHEITSSLSGKRIHRQDYPGGNTDASGFLTFSHAAGFTPTFVQVFSRAPAASFAMAWGTDSYAATSVRARFMHASSGGAYASAATGAFTAIFWE